VSPGGTMYGSFHHHPNANGGFANQAPKYATTTRNSHYHQRMHAQNNLFANKLGSAEPSTKNGVG
jgi:hypothetical protein